MPTCPFRGDGPIFFSFREGAGEVAALPAIGEKWAPMFRFVNIILHIRQQIRSRAWRQGRSAGNAARSFWRKSRET